MSDEEPVDPKVELTKKYHKGCEKDWKEYEECGKRVEKLGKESGKNCAGYYNGYYKCVDHAMAAELFTKLK